MASSEDIVREFCDAVSKRDPELLRPLLATDVVYHNIGMEPAKGVDDVLANLAGQWAMFSGVYEFEVRHLASAGNVVLTERVDTVGAEGQAAPVPVMGTFELAGGKITHWRDYFDTGLIAKMMSGEDVSALIS